MKKLRAQLEEITTERNAQIKKIMEDTFLKLDDNIREKFRESKSNKG